MKRVKVSEPPAKVHTGAEIMLVGLLLIVEHVSVVKNPLPVIVTAVRPGPELGISVMCGPVTMKVAVAKSPVLPVTLMVYVPGTAVAVTVKEAEVICPLEMVQEGSEIMLTPGLLLIVEHVSPLLNPPPLITTAVPAGPELGLRTIVGAGDVMAKVAVAKSPVLPRTLMVYVPTVELPTMKAVLVN